MAGILFQRYVWLADTIYRAGRITFAEINRRWLANSMSEGKPIPLRTFHKHREAIEAFFDIRIACYKPTNEYYIANKADLTANRLSRWLLDSFTAGNLMLENRSLRDRILVEEVPSASHLDCVLRAMREQKVLEIAYRPFYLDHPLHIRLMPYFVKLNERRWYLYGPTADNATVKVYALDRIEAIEATDQLFEYPDNFSPEEHLATSVGITTYADIPPCRIIVRCTGLQAQYLRTLPFHVSQEEIESHEEWSLFAFFLSPTDEFYRKVLYHREFMEIVAPDEVRTEYRQILEEMLEMHA